MLSDISQAFTPNFQSAMGASNFSAFMAVCSGSSTLINMLLSCDPGEIDVQPTSGTGTFTTGTSDGPKKILVDPKFFNFGSSGADPTVEIFATTLAHELGHATQPLGVEDWTGVNNPATAANLGLTAEGVALLAEYKVAKELNCDMHSGPGIQHLLDNVFNDTSLSPEAMQFEAIATGAEYYSSRHPSNAGALTYFQYYEDGFALSKSGINVSNVDWSKMTPEFFQVTQNPDTGNWVLLLKAAHLSEIPMKASSGGSPVSYSYNDQNAVNDDEASYLNIVATSMGNTIASMGLNSWSDENGRSYVFTPDPTFEGSGKGMLTISGGSLGDGNSVEISDFNLKASQWDADGFLGIKLPKSVTLSESGSSNEDIFTDGMKSFFVSLGTSSNSIQSVSISISGSYGASFELYVGSSRIQFIDGVATMNIAAGQSGALFTLVNTNDLGADSSLSIAATLSCSDDSSANVSSNSLTFGYTEYTFPEPSNPVIGEGVAVTGSQSYEPYTHYEYTTITSTGGSFSGGQDNEIDTDNGNNLIICGDIEESDVPSEHTSGNNLITCGTGNDSVMGADGQSTIVLGGGQDIYFNDLQTANGEDRVYADAAVDLTTAIEQSTSSSATGQQGDLILEAGGRNTIVGGEGNDFVATFTGDNIIVGGPGDDTIVGGAGWDLGDPLGKIWSASYTSADGLVQTGFGLYGAGDASQYDSLPGGYEGNFGTDGVALGVGDNTIFGGSGNDVIILSNGANYVDLGTGDSTVLGGMGDNTILGGSGNVDIQGGGGDDYIVAETGNDLIKGRGGDNTIVGGSGNDSIYAGSSGVDWATSESGNNLVEAGSGNSELWGAGGNDTLLGGSGDDSLYAGAGDEYLDGVSGNDILIGGAGNDTLVAGGDGADTVQAVGGDDSTTVIYGGNGSDLLIGGAGNNVIYSGDGGTDADATQAIADQTDASAQTTIYGGLGVNELFGGAGTSVIYGAAGTRQISAGSGETTIYGGASGAIIYGGSGTDVLYAGDGGTNDNPSYVIAGSGNATLYGGSGRAELEDTVNGGDLLVAGTAGDTLLGSGHDTLVSGSGNDLLQGESGSTYQFSSDFGSDVITAASTADILQFSTDFAPDDITASAVILSDNSAALALSSDGSTLLVGGGLTGSVNSIVFDDPETFTLKQFIAQGNFIDQDIASATGLGDLIFSGEDDASIAGSGIDTISAWGDNDTVTAGAFGSYLYAGGDFSSLVGSAWGGDTLVAGGATDSLIGGGENEWLEVHDASDIVQVQANDGTDTVASWVSYIAPDNIKKLTLMGSDDLSAMANDAGDTLTSNTGVDTLIGGAGDDTFIVNNSGDVVVTDLDQGTDVVLSSVSFVVPENIESLTLTGSADLAATGNDQFSTIYGNSGNDTLYGGDGTTTLVSGSGITTMYSGSGTDTFVVNNSADVVVATGWWTYADTVLSSVSYVVPENLTNLTLTGDADITAIGNSQSDYITGNAGNDTLTSGSGGGHLIAGTGVATLIGGTGYTNFVVNNSADVVVDESCNGEVDSSVDWTLGGGLQTLTLTGSDDLSAIGNDEAYNFLTGNSGQDTLIAGSADTHFVAVGGVDRMVSGTGDDTMSGLAGDTYVFGGEFGNDEIDQLNGPVNVEFGSGISPTDLTLSVDDSMSLLISDGDNSIDIGMIKDSSGSVGTFTFADGETLSFLDLLAQANIASSTVLAGPGNLGTGNLILNGDEAASLAGGAWNDTILAGGANDTLVAGAGNNLIFGGGTNDLLVASSGNDSLYGGAGDDTFVGGTGSATMHGGEGDDFYMLTEGGTTEIDSSSTVGTETLYLPAGASLDDYSHTKEGSDLLIESLDGDTSALIKGFYSASSTNKKWIIASDDDAPEFLANWAAPPTQSLEDYDETISAVESEFQATQHTALEKAGADFNDSGTDPYGNVYDNQFLGVTGQTVTLTGGTWYIPQSSTFTYDYSTEETSYQRTVPIYGTTTTNPASYYISLSSLSSSSEIPAPPGASVTPVYGPPGSDGGLDTGGQGELVGYEVTMPSVQRVSQTGQYVETVTATTGITDQTVAYTVYDVEGSNLDDSVIQDPATYGNNPGFVGSINTGNGNDDVELGSGAFLNGPTNDDHLLRADDDGFNAFIRAGDGNDTLLGTTGNDVIAAGTGNDYMDGGAGADTYYVPMQGTSTDIIYDSAAPDLGDLVKNPTAADPLDTLMLPEGITPENLTYHLSDYSETDMWGNPLTDSSGNPVVSHSLELSYGNSNVFVIFEDIPAPEMLPDPNNWEDQAHLFPVSTDASVGVDVFKFSDGETLTRAQLISLAQEDGLLTAGTGNPVVSVSDQTVGIGESLSAPDFIASSDTTGNSVVLYRITDFQEDDGYFALNGVAETAGVFTVSPSQLANLTYVGGTAAGYDYAEVSVFDGSEWGSAGFEIDTTDNSGDGDNAMIMTSNLRSASDNSIRSTQDDLAPRALGIKLNLGSRFYRFGNDLSDLPTMGTRSFGEASPLNFVKWDHWADLDQRLGSHLSADPDVLANLGGGMQAYDLHPLVLPETVAYNAVPEARAGILGNMNREPRHHAGVLN